MQDKEMKMAGKPLSKTAKKALPALHYPIYDELPADLVTLCDLVRVVNDAHVNLPLRARNRHQEFTASMASNYVKQKLTPPPVGKKYMRLHVCMILFAATIKLAFSAEDVIDITRYVFDGFDEGNRLKKLQDMLAFEFNTKTNEGLGCWNATEASAPRMAANKRKLIDLATSTFAEKVRSLVLVDQLEPDA